MSLSIIIIGVDIISTPDGVVNDNCRFTDNLYSKDMGQMVHNCKRVVKGLGCMTIKRLG